MFTKLKLSRRWIEPVGFFSFAWIVAIILHSRLDSTIMSPDSYSYLRYAVKPFAEEKDNYFPLGFSWFLYLCDLLRLSYPQALDLLAAGRVTVVFLLLRQSIKLLPSCLGAAFFFNPSWVLVGLTVWSENLFSFLTLLIALVLSIRSHPRTRLVSSLGLFAVLCFTRFAGIFFLPGVAVGLAYSKGISFKKFVIHFVSASISLLGVWVVLNLWQSGHPFSQTTHVPSCKFGIISMNELSFCQWFKESQICALDPKREVLNNPLYFNTAGLFRLHFGTSPTVHMGEVLGEDVVCAEYKKILHLAAFEHPFQFLGLMISRIYDQMGSWEDTERGHLMDPAHTISFLAKIDRWAESWQYFQPILRTLILFSFCIFISRKERWRPELLFLWVGGVAHAAGIAFTNPFLALRYMIIHQTLLWVFALFILITYVRVRILPPNKDVN